MPILPALIREGRFREDLYYRLNVIEIAVPPLADRPADILPLARHFLGEDLQLSEDAAAALLAHDWPGNVRELRNSIERAKLLAREQHRHRRRFESAGRRIARRRTAKRRAATPISRTAKRSRPACARRAATSAAPRRASACRARRCTGAWNASICGRPAAAEPR